MKLTQEGRQLQTRAMESLDDSEARKQWNWKPDWNIGAMTDDMLSNLKRKTIKFKLSIVYVIKI